MSEIVEVSGDVAADVSVDVCADFAGALGAGGAELGEYELVDAGQFEQDEGCEEQDRDGCRSAGYHRSSGTEDEAGERLRRGLRLSR